MSQKLKYGCINCNANDLLVTAKEVMTTSTVLPAKSGRFLVSTSSTGVPKAPATDTDALMWYCDKVTTGTSANDKLGLIPLTPSMIFEVPYATGGAAGTLTAAVGKTALGKHFDIYVDGNGVQYANSTTTDGLFVCVGYDVDENTLYVRVADAKITQCA